MTPFDILTDSARALYDENRTHGFTRDRNRAYNVLCSAITYLKTGTPLVGSRTREFFQ